MGGFVYIWFDVVKYKYYIGSHFGLDTDGYIGSGTYFKKAYNRRPQDFKRRIIERVYGSKKELLEVEEKWLMLIPDLELGVKYYNLKKTAVGGSVKGRKCEPRSEEYLKKIRKPKKNKLNYKYPKNENHKNNISKGLRKSDNLKNSGEDNPRYIDISNDEFKSAWIELSLYIKRQPTFREFRDWFKTVKGKYFPTSISKFRFNHGKELFAYVEKEYGLLRIYSHRS